MNLVNYKQSPYLSFFTSFFMFVFIIGLSAAIYSCEKYEAYEEDIMISKSKSLISGLSIDEFTSGKAAITLGFHKSRKSSLEHAMLAFEVYREGSENCQNKITVQCLDLCGSDFLISSYICTLKQTPTRVCFYELDTSLCFFVRSKRTLKNKETVYSPPIFDKYVSFIVDSNIALKAIKAANEDNGKVKFCLLGDAFSSNSHNCISYVTKVLCDAGIPIKFPFYWFKSPKNLRVLIDELSSTMILTHQDNQ